MGVDLLDIVFRLEKRFFIRIDRSDFTGPESEWINKSQQEIIDEYLDRLTVRFLCDLVEQKIREKNDGIESFPDVLNEVGQSVRATLSNQFNISDPELIKNEQRLDQLAELSESPLPVSFWIRFRRIQSDDPTDLTAIKSFILSREYVSAFKTSALSLGITAVLCIWLWIIGVLQQDVLYFLTALLVPSIVLFGLRFIVNWNRRSMRSQITVGEIIDHIVDQRRDHSVRPDGLPYNRHEIEQGVAKVLCEALAVKPEKITPDARIIKDLGAE